MRVIRLKHEVYVLGTNPKKRFPEYVMILKSIFTVNGVLLFGAFSGMAHVAHLARQAAAKTTPLLVVFALIFNRSRI